MAEKSGIKKCKAIVDKWQSNKNKNKKNTKLIKLNYSKYTTAPNKT